MHLMFKVLKTFKGERRTQTRNSDDRIKDLVNLFASKDSNISSLQSHLELVCECNSFVRF